MYFPDAVEALSALGSGPRLAVFRLLIKVGEGGMAAGAIAQGVGVRPNTLSTQLAILSQAGLIDSRRDGRSVIYLANYDGMRDLLDFLVADCCCGRPEICAPLTSIVQNSCSDA